MVMEIPSPLDLLMDVSLMCSCFKVRCLYHGGSYAECKMTYGICSVSWRMHVIGHGYNYHPCHGFTAILKCSHGYLTTRDGQDCSQYCHLHLFGFLILSYPIL